MLESGRQNSEFLTDGIWRFKISVFLKAWQGIHASDLHGKNKEIEKKLTEVQPISKRGEIIAGRY
jgi:hypothetical protein